MGMIALLTACTTPLFPPKAVQGLDPNLQMSIFSPESDVYFKGQVGQVGGRIISASPAQQGVLITAQGLPLKDLASPPIESASPLGVFVLLYQGPIDPPGIQTGNKFVVVGRVEGTQIVQVERTARPVPYLIARCLHVWKTGTYAMADFPNLPGGYSPLEQETYCLPQWQ